jgi:hypothetical protein
VIRVYDEAGNVIETHEHAGEFKARIADSSSINGVNFSSARTTKRFPSRCASTIRIVRPSESTAETHLALAHTIDVRDHDI